MPKVFKFRNVKFFTLFLSLLLVVRVNGQPIDKLRWLLKEGDFNAVADFIDKHGRQHDLVLETLRSIVGDYKEGVIQVTESRLGNNGKGSSTNNFTIQLLINKNKIFFYRVVKTHYAYQGGESVLNENVRDDYYADSAEWIAFEDLFRQTYGKSLDRADLFLTSIVFGEHCGITGEAPPFADQLNKYILDNNVEGIREWLKSANTEKQLYAVKGYRILTHQGYYPTEEEKRIISVIGKKEGTVSTCNGCLYSDMDIRFAIGRINSIPDEYLKPDSSNSPLVRVDKEQEATSSKKSYSWTFLIWVLAALAFLYVATRVISARLRRK